MSRAARGAALGLAMGALFVWVEALMAAGFLTATLRVAWTPLSWTAARTAAWGLLFFMGVGALLGLLGVTRRARWTWGLALLGTLWLTPRADLYLLASLAYLAVAAGAWEALRRWPRAGALTLAASLALSLGGPLRPRPALESQTDGRTDGLNVLLVVWDTVGADRLTHEGRSLTPALDALAAEGLRYTRAHASSGWTLPSHATLFTGLQPQAHGADRMGLTLQRGTTLAEHLSARGYATGLFTSNPWLAEFSGLSRGFARVEASWLELASTVKVARRFEQRSLGWQDKGAARSTQAFAGWLGGLPPDQPFFATVNLMEAHAPYHLTSPEARALEVTDDAAAQAASARHFGDLSAGHVDPSDADRAQLMALYRAGIRADDRALGALLDTLTAEGRLDNTLVIVTSDHGEMFGEGGSWGHDLLLNHALVHVPLVLRWPDGRAGEVDLPVGLVDVAPTVLAAVGAPTPEGLHGRPLPLPGDDHALRPLEARVVGAKQPRLQRRLMDAGYDPATFAVRSVELWPWRLVRGPKGQALYRVDLDPWEAQDLAALHPERVAELAASLEPGAGEGPLVLEGSGAPWDALEALGYVDGAP